MKRKKKTAMPVSKRSVNETGYEVMPLLDFLGEFVGVHMTDIHRRLGRDANEDVAARMQSLRVALRVYDIGIERTMKHLGLQGAVDAVPGVAKQYADIMFADLEDDGPDA